MQYQSFRGADVKEALSRVRASLGPDALIQSTRHVSNGRGGVLGHSWVEVTASAPSTRPTWQFEAEQRASTPPRFHGLKSPLATRHSGPPASALGTAHLERELSNLRAMLDELNHSRPPRERALSLLASMGIEGALARELAAGAGRHARRGAEGLHAWIAQRVSERLSVAGDPLLLPGQQIIVAVGNTGVGKTTTLAKLAARARLDLGRSVSVLSYDSYRVGAVEQWQRYASLMGLPFAALGPDDDLSRRASERNTDIVLIDTTGKTSSTTRGEWPLADHLETLAGRSLHTLLVLPAWLRGRDAERVHALYRDARPTGIVVSKLDETSHAGGVLHAAIPNALPLTYFCTGPRVPEDIHPASVEALVDSKALGCS